MKRILFLLSLVVLLSPDCGAKTKNPISEIRYDSYKGLVMCGYQGWFNAPGDGAGRGWHHYERGRTGFKPGSCTIDLWPDVSEYDKLYETEFVFDDGTKASVFSDYDASTTDTHFRWMKEYGIDGVFMQRFVCEIANPSGRKHFDRVLENAMSAANKYSRAICVMYDLSGMRSNGVDVLLNDIKEVSKTFNLFRHRKNPSYLYHNGKPLVTVWGVGFNDNRKYGFDEAERIIDALKGMGFSVMLGVPTRWRTLNMDTIPDARLHELICKCDILMPWFVGRYNEDTYPRFESLIKEDIKWAEEHGVDYAPLCFPGFSWNNMLKPGKPSSTIPRNSGSFFKKQLDFCIGAGAEMIYIAMFDEIDEGTAIFKLSKKVPVPNPGSTFIPLDEDVEPDTYLKIAGEAASRLRNR